MLDKDINQPPEEDSSNNCYFIPLARNRRYWRTYIRSCLVGKSIDELPSSYVCFEAVLIANV